MSNQRRLTANGDGFLALRIRAFRTTMKLLLMAVVVTIMVALAYIFPPDAEFRQDTATMVLLAMFPTAFWIFILGGYLAFHNLTPFYADETVFLPKARMPWRKPRPVRYEDIDGAGVQTYNDGSWSLFFSLKGGGMAYLHEEFDIPREARDFILEQLKKRGALIEFE